jgi:SHS2 domain-containing protein
MESFKLLDVTADVGIQCVGSTMQNLFNAALSGLYYIIFDEMINRDVLDVVKHDTLKTDVEDAEGNLFRLLEEAIYLIFEKKELMYIKEVDVQRGCINYIIYKSNLQIENEVKAVTLHNFEVTWSEEIGAWTATIIFDV